MLLKANLYCSKYTISQNLYKYSYELKFIVQFTKKDEEMKAIDYSILVSGD